MSIFGFGRSDKISSSNGLTDPTPTGQNVQAADQGEQGVTNGSQAPTQEAESPFVEIFGDPETQGDFELGEDFFNKESDAEVQGGQGKTTPVADPAQEQNSHLERVKTGLKSLVVTPDMIPTDFNINDPEHLNQFMSNAMQRAAAATMSLMAPTIQASMNQLMQQMEQKINLGVDTARGKDSAKAAFTPISDALERLNDKGIVALAQTTFQTALKKTKSPAKAQQATVNALSAIGYNVNLKSKSVQQRTQFGRDEDFNDESDYGIKTGASALNGFFGG